ncbi:acetoacetate decarboxylase family protein [Nocardioides bizhenqiangii]|uniref:Acetoacetate decarboxylase family protein n=1 Tax=Nocardioides bizhenqiangii TaxID=3095076 RepID=A0ABZ0ZPP8_9ACTN|nr:MULTISPECIES: acetoacetate decarboxylase family protein [unclassified Nocardioides]MDZ5619745.1 acetoacetate decarboxylase family protein [Nocardioides sp. HM23]WQQ26248.1 acetoacetate decarboxylase family protein [Nocardioides sp. HM61]
MTASHDILGRTVTMPVDVRDGSSATVIFDVALDAARSLAPPGFEVTESAPGRAQVALALIDYRDNDLGSYLEVGTILFVRPEGGGEDGTFITHLPVTEEFTCVAGNRIWGFPKSVEQIEVTNTDTTSRWVLTMDGQLVVDVTVPRGGSDEMPPLPMAAYTLIDGRPHVTRFTQGGSGSGVHLGADVALTLGDHPIAKELASLSISPESVVLSTWTERMQARFEEPVPL